MQSLVQPITPVIVKVIPKPTEELGVVDVLLQALGLTGILVLGSALLGLLLGVVFIWYNRPRKHQPEGGVASRYGFDLSTPR